MASRDARRQPFLEREPVALGANAAFKTKMALAQGVTQTTVNTTVSAALAAHEAAADPHDQYTANDPALRS